MEHAIGEYPKPPLPHAPQPLEPQERRMQAPTVIVYERQQWEYKVIVREPPGDGLPSESELNGLGRAGWELAGVLPVEGRVQLIFKRTRR